MRVLYNPYRDLIIINFAKDSAQDERIRQLSINKKPVWKAKDAERDIKALRDGTTKEAKDVVRRYEVCAGTQRLNCARPAFPGALTSGWQPAVTGRSS